jgi:dicarboxylate/amino acid:cation (Na+ or H+) symporter, DAACS family
MIVVPMVFSALVIGVYELGRGHDLAGVASRTLAFTVVLSTLSVTIGIALVNLVRPGQAFPIQTTATQNVDALRTQAAGAKSVADTIVELIPRNPVETAVRALDGDMLQLMIFALIFGIAVSAATEKGRDNIIIRLLEQVFEACMRIVHFVMQLAPVAVFAIIFNTAFTFGTAVFASLFLYVLTVVAGLALQQRGGDSAMLAIVARRSPHVFFRQCRDVYLYAFSTASSNATLPLSLEVAEAELRLPPHISASS